MCETAIGGVVFLAASVACAAPGDATFDRLVDDYYAGYSAMDPVAATDLGLHDHDHDLPDYSADGIRRRIARLRDYQARFGAIASDRLSSHRAIDLAMVRSGIASELFSLLESEDHRHRPDLYSDLASSSVYTLIHRKFAPAADRLRSVVARERQIPALLEAGARNLVNVPKAWLEIALDELPGTIDFLQKDVPAAFASVADPGLQRELTSATRVSCEAIARFRLYLQKEVAPKTTSKFALGEQLFRRKLEVEEMITTPLDELLLRGENELHRLQREFKAVATQIDRSRPVAEVQLEIQKDHGRPQQLLDEVRRSLRGIQRFIVDRKLLSLGTTALPEVEETPPFLRAYTMASMNTPGPFELQAKEAFYHVTLPEKTWSEQQIEDFMRGAFSRSLIEVVSIHEALPGHYIQFVWLPKNRSKVRKFESTKSNVEGWAHYCEQMMLDEGYGGGDPKLRLSQLQDALLRAARYVVGIRMHTRGMSPDEAVTFFQKEGYQTRKVAEMEVRRGTEDPTYLYYTAGKLELLRLRDDYKKKLGAAYTLQKFHDAVLAEGPIALPLLRRALLGP